jgi:hypothetical protein
MTIDLTHLVIGIGAFLGGYFFARLDSVYALLRSGVSPQIQATQKPTSFFDKERQAERAEKKLGGISIDSSKVVTKIDTAGIEKGSNVEFGRTTSQQDGLKTSVSKLSQLKGR